MKNNLTADVKIVPASTQQEGVWFHAMQNNTAYWNIIQKKSYRGVVDIAALKSALKIVVSRHSSLRSTFSVRQEKLYQVIHESVLLVDFFEHLKFDEDDQQYIDQIIHTELAREKKHEFDFEKECLLRFKLLEFKHTHYFILTVSHIITDVISTEIFWNELGTFYSSSVNGKETALSLPGNQYFNYCIEHDKFSQSSQYKSQWEYWVNKLSGGLPVLNFSFNTENYEPTSHREEIKLPSQIRQDLRTFSLQKRVLLSSVFQLAYFILLHKYSGDTKIVIGNTVHGRGFKKKGYMDVVGLFANRLTNVQEIISSESIEDLLVRVNQDLIDSFENGDIPYEELQRYLSKKNKTGLAHLFQAVFNVIKARGTNPTFDGLEEDNKLYDESSRIGDIQFDVGLTIFDDAQNIWIGLELKCNKEFQPLVRQQLQNYLKILYECIYNPKAKIVDIDYLTDAEKQQLVREFNATEKEYQKDRTIHELFRGQAERTPDNTALVYEEQKLTFKELNERGNQLARHIREQYKERTGKEMRPGTLIALCLDRSLEMVVGILGVLKAGGAYVPMDPSYPQDRIDYLIGDTKSGLVLTQHQVMESSGVQLAQDKILYIDLTEELYAQVAKSNLPSYSTSEDLAYVIYTSGTTGRPKGVMVEHGSICNTINDLYSIYNRTFKATAYTSYVFDVSVSEIFASLLQGLELHILTNATRIDSEALSDYFVDNKINLVYLPPVLLSKLPERSYPDLDTLIYAGEPCGKQTARRWSSAVKMYNYYGPTESSVYTTSKQIESDEVEQIGRPIQNTQVYVLDSYRHPVPIGVIGELYIGGAGLARGYLNNKELTEERFVSNPFATDGDKKKGYTRLYKTGDLARWLPDRNLEYIGRNDEQVKIHGYRIELGEIEHALTQIAGIKQACVLARERKTDTDSTKYLVGYYVLDAGHADLTQGVILEALSKVLPEYMVPAALVEMESFPLTINGKLDRRALPDPDFGSKEERYVGPRTEVEKVLAKIWQEVLGVDRVGVTDDFFRVGGDSILSIQVSSRIRQAGFSCQVKDIFSYKTIEKLSAYVDNNQSGIAIKSERGLLTGALGLLPIQEWFTDRVERGELEKPNHWNQSFLVRVPELDESKLASIIKELVAYHDVLRMKYIQGDYWQQVYQGSIELPEVKTLDVRQHTSAEIHQILTDWQSGFDLEQGPLFQTGYLYGYEDGSARVYFALQHMIVDGVSWRIIAEDIKTLYSGGSLPAKGSSYRQWVECVKAYAGQHAEERSYWQKQLEGMLSYAIPKGQVATVASVELSKGLTKSLLQQSSKAYHTEINDLLLTALAYALRDINENTVQGITLEGHGRETMDTSIDHSHTVGWFTTMFPVKLELKGTLKESIQCIKENLRMIPNKGIGFGAFAIRERASFTHDDLAPVSFNYLGQFGTQQGAGGEWEIVSEDSGRSIHRSNGDHNLININGMVSNGKLRFSIVTKLGEQTTKQLTDSLKGQLTNIIEHCEEKLEKDGRSYTPSDFKGVRLSQLLLDGLETSARASENELAHIYPATSLQQGFIYHALSQTDDDAYRVQLLLDYHHKIDVDKYIKAWEKCIEQYPILRTAFNWEEDLIQVIYKKGKLEYQLHDISDLSTQHERDAAIDTIQVEDRKRSFDLTKPTLLRLHIIKQTADYYTILKSEHHSIADGWSGPILLTSLHQHYQALTANRKVTIKEDTAYLAAQEYIISHKASISDYWNRTLANVEVANDINELLSNPIDALTYGQVSQPAASTLKITGENYKALKAFGQKEGVTVNVIVQFMWHKLLQVYSGRTQSIVGTTVSGRTLPIEGIEDSVGLYINTLPLVIDWENEITIQRQLHQIQSQITALNAHSFADLAKLQKDGERLFHSLVV